MSLYRLPLDPYSPPLLVYIQSHVYIAVINKVRIFCGSCLSKAYLHP